MTVVSLVAYIIANIAGIILYAIYRPKEDQEPGGAEVEEFEYIRSMRQRPSLFAILGIQETDSRYFRAIDDNFQTFDEVSRACKRAGLETCGLIFGVDFSASNEWQGRKTFSGQCLHKLTNSKISNPYQKVISIMGRTLEAFDGTKCIPAFGFGDSETKGDTIFPFFSDGSPCCAISEVLERYSEVAARVTLSGPTNYAPIINKAIEIVKALRQYHILVIIADGQIKDQKSTVDAIVEASGFPISIVFVGVGDGPWGLMKHFDDKLSNRKFDNFQFVSYHSVTAKTKRPDLRLALHVMMEIPDQYRAIKSLGYLDEPPST